MVNYENKFAGWEKTFLKICPGLNDRTKKTYTIQILSLPHALPQPPKKYMHTYAHTQNASRKYDVKILSFFRMMKPIFAEDKRIQ